MDKRKLSRLLTEILEAVKEMAIEFEDEGEMCESRPVQLDCRVSNCRFHLRGGTCTHPNLSLTLNIEGKFVCWRMKEKKEW